MRYLSTLSLFLVVYSEDTRNRPCVDVLEEEEEEKIYEYACDTCVSGWLVGS